jgi:hypothetical protein
MDLETEILDSGNLDSGTRGTFKAGTLNIWMQSDGTMAGFRTKIDRIPAGYRRRRTLGQIRSNVIVLRYLVIGYWLLR